mgnify:CR=1 FL=1
MKTWFGDPFVFRPGISLRVLSIFSLIICRDSIASNNGIPLNPMMMSGPETAIFRKISLPESPKPINKEEVSTNIKCDIERFLSTIVSLSNVLTTS